MNQKRPIKPYFFLFLVLNLVSFSNELKCQAIYEFNYHSPNNKSISNIKALMFNYPNDADFEGGDFVRLHYFDSTLKKSVILNLSLVDSIVKDKNGLETDHYLILKTSKISKIRPLIETPTYEPDMFLLSNDLNTEYLLPSAIITHNGLDPIKVSQLSIDSLTTKKLEYYFDKTEPLFDQILNSETRDDHKIPSESVLHFILVADTDDNNDDSKDYLDFRLDKKKLLDFYSDIAGSLNMKLDTLLFYGSTIYQKNIKKDIQKSINALKVGPNDLIFFHYTGHGFNKNTSINDSLPSYLLAKEKIIDTKNKRKLVQYYKNYAIEMGQMDQWLIQKGARSTFLFSDCCNNSIMELQHTDIEGQKKVGANKGGSLILSPSKCKSLFYDATYSIMVAAAQKNQAAWSTHEKGSFCTKSYIDNVKNALSIDKLAPKQLNWNMMLNVLKRATFDNVQGGIIGRPKQNPIVVIR